MASNRDKERRGKRKSKKQFKCWFLLLYMSELWMSVDRRDDTTKPTLKGKPPSPRLCDWAIGWRGPPIFSQQCSGTKIFVPDVKFLSYWLSAISTQLSAWGRKAGIIQSLPLTITTLLRNFLSACSIIHFLIHSPERRRVFFPPTRNSWRWNGSRLFRERESWRRLPYVCFHRRMDGWRQSHVQAPPLSRKGMGRPLCSQTLKGLPVNWF